MMNQTKLLGPYAEIHHPNVRSTTKGPRLLSIKRAMYELSLGRTKFYELVTSEKLKTVTIGRRRYVTVDAIDEFIAGLSADGESK